MLGTNILFVTNFKNIYNILIFNKNLEDSNINH